MNAMRLPKGNGHRYIKNGLRHPMVVLIYVIVKHFSIRSLVLFSIWSTVFVRAGVSE